MAEHHGRDTGASIHASTYGLALVLAFVVLVSACGRDTTPKASPGTRPPPENVPIIAAPQEVVRGGAMSYAVEDTSNGFNPMINEWAASGLTIARTFFDTLTAFDDHKNIQPFLLESFAPSPDYMRWTLKLRAGIKYSNGHPVTAESVAREQTIMQHGPIYGGAYSTVDSFTARDPLTDPLTIDVAMKVPDATFPMLLSTQVGVVADPDWLVTNDAIHPVGTGPFILQTWDRGADERLTVTANPNYWRHDANGARLPYIDKIEFRVISDPATRIAALENGDVDAMQATDTPTNDHFKDQPDWHIYTDSSSRAKQMAMLNTQAEPFDDIDARRALAYATDVKAYQAELHAGSGVMVDSPFGPGSPWHIDTDYPEFDQAKARELVEKVKARHNGKFTFTLSASDDPIAGSIALNLQRQWSAVGIDVMIHQEPLATQIIKIVTGQYQAHVWLQFDAADPALDEWWWDQANAVAPPGFTLNLARIKDPVIGEALTRARSTTNIDVRRAAWADLQKRLADLVPYVWLGEEGKSIIAGPKVVNLVHWQLPSGDFGLPLTQGGHSLAQVSFKL